MKKTIERSGIKISLTVSKDNVVSTKSLMDIEFALPDGEVIKKQAYPQENEQTKVATVDEQFELAKSLFRFEKAYKKAGGARPGAGNKPGSKRVEVRKEQHTLTISGAVFLAFKDKYGRDWCQRVEDLMLEDMVDNQQ